MDARRSLVALVTGSGRKRLGWHVAESLAKRGDSVAVHYHDSAAEAAATVGHLRGFGCDAEAFGADLARAAECARLVREVIARFGRIDVLVNTAAIWAPCPLEAVDEATFERYFLTNVGGSFFCGQQAGLAMAAQPEGGCIVNFGDWAVRRPYRDHAAYFAAKGAIPTLTRCLAVELGSRNPKVRVNCVEPGPAMLPDDLAEAERRAVAEANLARRTGTPESIVKAVLYLIDDEFVTGVCLPVDGGRSIYAGGL